MEKVVIEIIKDNGVPKYAVSECKDNDLNQLARIAVGTVSTYVKMGGNPQAFMQQAQPMMKQMMGGMR
jgi:hypothetical protein